jgi:hypothetical protein
LSDSSKKTKEGSVAAGFSLRKKITHWVKMKKATMIAT